MKFSPPAAARAWLASVVCLERVQSSGQSVAVQTAWKQRFDSLTARVLSEWPRDGHSVFETPEGATLCFWGNPETPMFCALHLVKAVAEDTGPHPFRVRAGIHLGPVTFDNAHAAGEGIAGARRVMGLAAENQILVSRSFYEAASAISESYAGLFKAKDGGTSEPAAEPEFYELHPPEAARTMLGSDTAAVPHPAPLISAQADAVERALAEAIGPIAPHLLRIVLQHAENPPELCAALLAFIPADPARKEFLRACGEIFRTAENH